MGNERLAEGDDTLLDTGAGTLSSEKNFSELLDEEERRRRTNLDDNEVVLHDTVTHEATHGGDRLDGRVELGGSRGGVLSLADAVDLLVEFGTVVVSVLRAQSQRRVDENEAKEGRTCPARATEYMTLDGCQAPMQATLRSPLWVLRGSFLVPQRWVTPSNP